MYQFEMHFRLTTAGKAAIRVPPRRSATGETVPKASVRQGKAGFAYPGDAVLGKAVAARGWARRA